MIRYVRSISLICLVVNTCLLAPAEDDVKSFQNYLKSANLNLVNPATKDFTPGGLVVSDGKTASYNPLPSGATFTPSAPTQQAFYQDTVGKNFSLAALLAGLGSVLHAGLSVNHSNTTTVNQIDATAQSVDGQTVVDNAAVAGRIGAWIQPGDKKPKYQVFVVIKTFSSKTISVSDNSSLGIAAAFGTDVPTCPDASGTPGATTGAGAKGTTGTAGTTGPRTLPEQRARRGQPRQRLQGEPARRPRRRRRPSPSRPQV